MKTTTSSKATERKAEITESRYGSLEVRISVTVPWVRGQRADYRAVRAEAYRLAAEVELATVPGDGWCVSVSNGSDNAAAVVIELAKGTKAEAERALVVARAALESKATTMALEERTARRLA